MSNKTRIGNTVSFKPSHRYPEAARAKTTATAPVSHVAYSHRQTDAESQKQQLEASQNTNYWQTQQARLTALKAFYGAAKAGAEVKTAQLNFNVATGQTAIAQQTVVQTEFKLVEAGHKTEQAQTRAGMASDQALILKAERQFTQSQAITRLKQLQIDLGLDTINLQSNQTLASLKGLKDAKFQPMQFKDPTIQTVSLG